MRRLAYIASLILLLSQVSLAVQPDEMLKDPALEVRARHLSGELRCMVCQNQSIDDSEAPLARDLRLLVRQRLVAGDTDQQVLDFLVARYGDFVLLKPPVRVDTLLLWGVAPAVLLAGMVGLFIAARRRKTPNLQTAVLTTEEQARLAAVLERHHPENI